MAGRPVVPSDMIVDPPDRRIPYTPEAAAVKNRRYENRHSTNAKLRDPIARCLLAGVPRFEFLQPFRIIQNPEYAFTHKRTAEQGFELLEDACYEGLQAAPH